MAKPLNPYQGAAPAAMGQMGQGILEAGANIGRTLQSGYESMGKSIGEGIKSAAGSVASAYTQSKEDQAKFNATKDLFKAFEGFLPKEKNPETGKDYSPMADKINGVLNDTTISTREKIAMAPMLFNIIGNAQQQYGVNEQQKAAMDRLKYSEGAAGGRLGMSIAAQKAQPFYEMEAKYPLTDNLTNPFSGPQDFSIKPQAPVKRTLGRHF